MIYRSEANCQFCTNYLGDRKCRAFAAEIPDNLWTGENLHREHYEGDQGILFQPKKIIIPDAETFMSGDY